MMAHDLKLFEGVNGTLRETHVTRQLQEAVWLLAGGCPGRRAAIKTSCRTTNTHLTITFTSMPASESAPKDYSTTLLRPFFSRIHEITRIDWETFGSLFGPPGNPQEAPRGPPGGPQGTSQGSKTSNSHQTHIKLTSNSHQAHIELTSNSHQAHIDLTSTSQRTKPRYTYFIGRGTPDISPLATRMFVVWESCFTQNANPSKS